MLKRFLIVTAVTLLVTVTAVASDREDDVNRTHKAAQIFQEIMNTPDHAIPHDLLDSAKCIAIIPGDVKFAFIFGGNYGRGVATCRTGHGWSAPMFCGDRRRKRGLSDRGLIHRHRDALYERSRLA